MSIERDAPVNPQQLNIAIGGPRGSGKSHLLQKIQQLAEAEGWVPLIVDHENHELLLDWKGRGD